MLSHFNTAIQCLSLVTRFHQIPAQPCALIREFQYNDESVAEINLIRAAKSLGFKAKFIKDNAEHLSEHLFKSRLIISSNNLRSHSIKR